jgi:hypothetical protein
VADFAKMAENTADLRSKAQSDLQALFSTLREDQRDRINAAIAQYGSVEQIPEDFWEHFGKELYDGASAALVVLMSDVYGDEMYTLVGGTDGEGDDIDWEAGFTYSHAHHAIDLSREIMDDWGDGIQDRLKAGRSVDEATSEAMSGRVANYYATKATTAAQKLAANDIPGALGAEAMAGLRVEKFWTCHPEQSATGPCEICEPLDGLPGAIWGLQFPFGPPDPHPNCVCKLELQLVPEGVLAGYI